MTELRCLCSEVARALWRDRAYTGALVFILALGVGGTAAILATLRATILQQLPFAHPEQLVRFRDTVLFSHLGAGGGGQFAWLPHVSSLQAASHYAAGDVNVVISGRAERLKGAQVSPSFFSTLGATPAIGAGLPTPVPGTTPASSAAPPAVVVSHRFWTDRLAASRTLDDLAITVNGKPVTIVGVMPQSFRFPDGVDVWLPDTVGGDTLFRGARSFHMIGRLADQSSLPALRNELNTLHKAHLKAAPQLKPVAVTPLHDALLGGLSTPLFAIASSGAALLLLAVFDIASLTLARTVARRRDFAIRAALGESRRQALASVLGESLVLGALGLAIAWPVAHYGIVVLRHVIPLPLPEYRAIAFDPVTILSATATCVIVAFGISAIPSLIGGRYARAGETLAADTPTTTGSASSLRWMRALVCVQFAISIPLLAAAVLLARSLNNIVATDPGFQREELVTVDVALSHAHYTTPARVTDYYARLMAGFRQVPGVTSVGAVNYLPLSGTPSISFRFQSTSRAVSADGPPPVAGYRVVSGQYLEAMGLSPRRGRLFNADDAATRTTGGQSSEPIVVNESFARAYWPGIEPIGQTLTMPGVSEKRVFTVVGEVGDVRHHSLKRPGGPEVFMLHATMPSPFMSVVVRSRLPVSTVAPALHAVARSVDAAQPLSAPRRMTDVVADTYRLENSTTILVTCFALVASLLSFAGAFTLVTRFVRSRQADLAIRVVLGVTPTGIHAFVASHLAWPLVVGVAIGAALTTAFAHTLTSIVFGVSTGDLTVLIGVPMAVLAIGGGTLFAAAHRAVRYDSLPLLIRR